MAYQLLPLSYERNPPEALRSYIGYSGEGVAHPGFQARYLWTFDDRDLYEIVICGPEALWTFADQMPSAVVVYPSYRGQRLVVYKDDRVTVTFAPQEVIQREGPGG